MASGKLLIVDDNALVRQMIASLARELGLFVIEAASIDAAQAPLADGDIDMLLCDDDLGNGRSGMEFIASDSARMPAKRGGTVLVTALMELCAGSSCSMCA